MRDETWFRLRGWIPIPAYAAVFSIALARGPLAGTGLELALGAAITLAGIALRCWARLHIGRSSDTRRLHARRLITTGPFARLRNPLYAGNLAIATGLAVLIGARALSLPLILLLALHYHRVVLAEERMLAITFGADYDVYRASIPRWFPHIDLRATLRSLTPLRREARIAALALLVAALALALRG